VPRNYCARESRLEGTMKFPSKVNVGGVTYEIHLTDDSVYAEDEYGRVSFTSRIITIHNQHDHMVNWQVLMHELLHVFSYHFKLDLDTDDTKHDNMDTLACQLIDTMVRNKWVRLT
jgi:hypothetical protein